MKSYSMHRTTLSSFGFVRLLVFILCSITSLMLTSCENDEPPIRATNVHLSVSLNNDDFARSYICNGDTLRGRVAVDYEKSTNDLQVKKMRCYLGGRLIGSSNNDSVTFSFPLLNEPLGSHELLIETETAAPHYTKTISSWSATIHVVEERPELRLSTLFDGIRFDEDRQRYILSNGQLFTLTTQLSEANTMHIDMETVDFIWDDEKLYTDDTTPYLLSHTFHNQIQGDHKLSIRYNFTFEDYVLLRYTYTRTFTVCIIE